MNSSGSTFVRAAAMAQLFAKTFKFRGDEEVLDYDGPLDLRLKVKGYSPKRTKEQAPSQILVLGERDRKLDRGPRVIRVRDEDHA